jgi:hypothetical protein
MIEVFSMKKVLFISFLVFFSSAFATKSDVVAHVGKGVSTPKQQKGAGDVNSPFLMRFYKVSQHMANVAKKFSLCNEQHFEDSENLMSAECKQRTLAKMRDLERAAARKKAQESCTIC